MLSLKYMFEEDYGVRLDMVRPIAKRIPVQPTPGVKPPMIGQKNRINTFKPIKIKSTTLTGQLYKAARPIKADDRAVGGFPNKAV